MKRNWTRRARYFLAKHNVINGYNGRSESPEEKQMVKDLAATFARIYNYPPTE